MQCAQCGYSLSAFDTDCPRCKHLAGMPVNAPTTPAQTPIEVNVSTSAPIGRAVSAGFFGMIGVWLASLGLGCLVPLFGCGTLLAIGAVLATLAALGSSHH